MIPELAHRDGAFRINAWSSVAGDAEARETLRRIFEAFDFQPDAIERSGNLLDRSRGFEVVLEPGPRELRLSNNRHGNDVHGHRRGRSRAVDRSDCRRLRSKSATA